MVKKLSVSEQMLYEWGPGVLKSLLFDRTTGKNIVWATADYVPVSFAYKANSEITVAAITGRYSGIASPRTTKTKELQNGRTRDRAEVFTPSWLCNEQNNLIDEAWFGRRNVFNTPSAHGWRTTKDNIAFPVTKSRTWKEYVDERRLEITCGEAPYLVSRYDPTTGEPIKLGRRIGLLDRKMRVVKENSTCEEEWLRWSERAFQSVYGFEIQGDSLLLARENLLASYEEYMWAALKRRPTRRELGRIALIISWNLWQMDGLTCAPPYEKAPQPYEQGQLFSTDSSPTGMPCLIRDWRTKKTISFISLISKK